MTDSVTRETRADGDGTERYMMERKEILFYDMDKWLEKKCQCLLMESVHSFIKLKCSMCDLLIDQSDILRQLLKFIITNWESYHTHFSTNRYMKGVLILIS